MPAEVIAAAMIALAATGADNGPVRTYTRNPDPSRSAGLQTTRPFNPAGDPRRGLLITPAPYPDAKADGPDRVENGRIWVSRSPVGNRTPIREQPRGFPGPASYGAGTDRHDDVIFVQTDLLRSVVAISPWVRIEELDRQVQNFIDTEQPFYSGSRRLTRLQGPRILKELREAQNQWLQEQGYILNVRTHVNPATVVEQMASAPAEERPEPRAVIRVVPHGKPAKPSNDPRQQAQAEPQESDAEILPIASPADDAQSAAGDAAKS